MAYDLQIAEHANGQIDQLTSYLVNNLQNVEAAKHFLDCLEDIYKRLEDNPYQFPQCTDKFLKRQGYRDAIMTEMRYRVVFRIDGQIVYIVGVFHTLENYVVKLETYI